MESPLPPLSCQRAAFSLPAHISYLNCAYMSPLMKTAAEAGQAGLLRKTRPFEIEPQDFFLETIALKAAFAELIGAEDPRRIAIIPAVSYGMAVVAQNLSLKSGDNIVLAAEQFPSNVYSFHRVAEAAGAEIRVVEAPEGASLKGTAWNEALLEAIDDRTRMLAISHVFWADGTPFDLEHLRARTREVGAWMVVDGTQSVGALPFSIEKLQPDALVCASYKWLMGPYSIGLAYFGSELDQGIPIEENWINRLGSEDFSGLVNYQPAYQALAARYDVGERSNFILIPMLIAALKQLLAWRPERIQTYCEVLSKETLQLLNDAGFAVAPESQRSKHLFGIELPSNIEPNKLKQQLAEASIYTSIRGNFLRIAPNVYNRKEDLERLYSILMALR